MKRDIDRWMQEEEVDVLLVTGAGFDNPAMVYLTGGAHLTDADLFKKRGEPAVLFHGAMEREEAARTGLKTRCFTEFPLDTFLKEAHGDQIRAKVLLYCAIFRSLEINSGRVALYGQMDAGTAFAVFSGLQQELPGITLIGYKLNGVLLQAMATKDSDEVERIRAVGRLTTEVVAKTADYLTHQQVKDEMLFHADGQPVTLGEVKRKIDLWLSERGLINPEGTIFSMGHDAGVPHSTGTDSDVLRLGVPIVYDIFPCEAGGGYFHDFTRTWCLGYAPDETLAVYQDVLKVLKTLEQEIEPNTPFNRYHLQTCEMFEAMGHPTIFKNPAETNGFVHGLGHGVGLQIHELPFYRASIKGENELLPGSVIAVEPGLYYPEKNIGVRLENTYWINPDGKLEVLVEYPLDLVLPMQN